MADRIKWQYYVNGWERPDERITKTATSNLDGFMYDVFMLPGPISRGDLSPCCGALTVVHVQKYGPDAIRILECTWCRMGCEYGDGDAWNLGDDMGGYHAAAE